MKTLIFSMLLLVSSICFAGPEDHAQSQICYSLEAKDLSQVSPMAPTQLCFEQLEVDTNKSTIGVYSYFREYEQFYKNLAITSLIRKNEDTYSYSAKAVIFEQAERHCEDGLKLVLKFEGDVDFMGYGDIGAQKLSLVQESQADICHSTNEVSTFKYIRIN